MVARHDDLRMRQAIQKAPRQFEFRGASTLGQITRDYDHVGAHCCQVGSEAVYDCLVNTPEMQVRQVSDASRDILR